MGGLAAARVGLRSGLAWRAFYAALAVCLGYVLLRLLTEPAFAIRRIDVRGSHFLAADQVADATAVRGRDVFLVSSRRAQERVLALGVPEEVQVSLALPDTAIVRVVERRPAYIWKVDPTLYLVAADGTVLGPTTEESLPVIVVDADHEAVRVGDRVDARLLREVAYLRRVLPSVADLSPHYFLRSRAYGLIVPAPPGIEVALGDDENLPAKLAALAPALVAARASHPPATFVDVRLPRHPYFR